VTEKSPQDYKSAIAASGVDIYAPIEIGDPDYWIPTPHLEALLNEEMRGLSLAGLPMRTRSKIIKTSVCHALGYPVPASFKKMQPRFFGQQLDAYGQKALNLQIWNEELSPTRRYALLQISSDDVVLSVKVVNGQELALLDTTGKITTKYQASLDVGIEQRELISSLDTPELRPHTQANPVFHPSNSPIDEPESGSLMPISEVFECLSSLVGASFADPGVDQERNRGAALHRLVCARLGYSHFQDKGQFPDVRHQLLEVKLQTSRTIDLGLVLPDSEGRADIGPVGDHHPRHCDIRYAMFFATTDRIDVTLTHLFVVTGAEFFSRFRRFEGRVKNGKIQIPLPRDFFAV
jgi:hypothetical protein